MGSTARTTRVPANKSPKVREWVVKNAKKSPMGRHARENSRIIAWVKNRTGRSVTAWCEHKTIATKIVRKMPAAVWRGCHPRHWSRVDQINAFRVSNHLLVDREASDPHEINDKYETNTEMKTNNNIAHPNKKRHECHLGASSLRRTAWDRACRWTWRCPIPPAGRRSKCQLL